MIVEEKLEYYGFIYYTIYMISFTLHKTIASQIIVQSTKFNGRHSLSP